LLELDFFGYVADINILMWKSVPRVILPVHSNFSAEDL